MQKKLDWLKDWILVKDPQFLSNQADIQEILPTHGLVILTKFHKDLQKIKIFLAIAKFWASLLFLHQSLNPRTFLCNPFKKHIQNVIFTKNTSIGENDVNDQRTSNLQLTTLLCKQFFSRRKNCLIILLISNTVIPWIVCILGPEIFRTIQG